MPLIDEIRALRDRSLTELTIVHDYYSDTKAVWLFVQRTVLSGQKFTLRNRITGSVTREDQLAGKVRDYVSRHLSETTFQQFVSIFESFLFDFLRLWLMAYPQSLSSKQLTLRDVLDAPDKTAVTLEVVNKELIEVAYRRPKDWFKYLAERAEIKCSSDAEIEEIAEAKAARDVLAHNRGIASKTYVSKSGTSARFGDGQRLEIPEEYHRKTWELFRKVIADLAASAEKKLC